MTTILSEGVIVPDVGDVNWAGKLEVNWNLLNGALANLSGNVKLDRDNTWTGEQSFTLPIVGSITGTASKAIADEDGTSIKTGYVNVAGNQTVTGQKTFSANIHFTSGLYQRNTTYEIGTTPASNINITQFLADKDSKYTGCLRNAISTTGLTSVELEARNKVGSGALSPTGNATSSTFKVEVQPDGTKTLYFDGSIRNNVLPYATNTYSLGSSSYQWSSVYAQSYYYNGTQWGLDQSNNWTGSNIFTGSVILPAIGSINYKNYGIVTAYGYTQYNNYFSFFRTVGIYGTDNTPDTSKPSFLTFRPMRLQTELMDNIQVCNDGTNNYLAPITTGVTDLGTSTNKWKTLNGVNPGALSFPDGANYINVGGSILPNGGTATAFDGSANYFTPTITGWLSLAINSCSDLSVWASSMRYGQRTIAPSTGQNLQVMLPVFAGQTYEIYIIGSSINTARLFPCLGNV